MITEETREKLRISHLGQKAWNRTHGLSNTRIWRTYHNVHRRCTVKTNNRYYRYGARGIKCEWVSFQHFLDDMHPSYLKHVKKYGEKNTQIDRIDNDRNYCKENCRWVTIVEQAQTRSTTLKIKINGQTKSLREWCKTYKQPYTTVHSRIKYSGMNVKKALEIPIGKVHLARGYTKKGNHFEAQSNINHNHVYIGSYKTEKEAHNAYKKYILKHKKI